MMDANSFAVNPGGESKMVRTRRDVMGAMGLAGLRAVIPGGVARAMISSSTNEVAASCPFRLAVINDEISQDFEHACQVASGEFGLQWIELRSMWNKNLADLNAKEISDAQKILAEHKLRVTDLASPLFKTDWPGAPISKQSEKRDQFHADFDAASQDRLLERCLVLTREFKTRRLRCFDFWRLDDQKPYRAAINARLQRAADRCAKDNVILLLENEMSCNTATGEEAAAVLEAIPNRNFMLNWDPGNAAALFTVPYPTGYDLLPKERIGHCHCKDVIYKPGHKYEWAPVGGGVVDWVGQFKALQRSGYHLGVSLETHWRGAGSPEASSRVSMAGLKKTLGEAGIHC